MNKEQKNIWNRLQEYMNLNAISRHEETVVDKLKENLTKDIKYERDGLGSVIFSKVKQNNGPKILVAAHMDEVGFLVQDILKNGQIKLAMVGGIWPLTIIGTKGILENSNGKKFEGIYGHTSIHILEPEKRTVAPQAKELFLDLGFSSKDEVTKNNIEIGNKVYLTGEPFIMNEFLVAGKAMDNRAGVVVIDQLLKRLSSTTTESNWFIAGTTQEEIGTRGAKTTTQMIEPDVAIAIDTCASHDTFGAKEGVQKLSAGAAIRIMDASTMMDPKLVNWISNLAKENNIKIYNYIAQGGGTDAASLQYGGKGVATITISLPQRYLHSPLGVCDIRDIEAAIDIIEKIIIKLNSTEFENKIIYK